MEDTLPGTPSFSLSSGSAGDESEDETTVPVRPVKKKQKVMKESIRKLLMPHVAADLSSFTEELNAAELALEYAERVQDPYLYEKELYASMDYHHVEVDELKRWAKVHRTFSAVMAEVEENGGNMNGLYLYPPDGYRYRPSKPKTAERPPLWAPKRSIVPPPLTKSKPKPKPTSKSGTKSGGRVPVPSNVPTLPKTTPAPSHSSNSKRALPTKPSSQVGEAATRGNSDQISSSPNKALSTAGLPQARVVKLNTSWTPPIPPPIKSRYLEVPSVKLKQTKSNVLGQKNSIPRVKSVPSSALTGSRPVKSRTSKAAARQSTEISTADSVLETPVDNDGGVDSKTKSNGIKMKKSSTGTGKKTGGKKKGKGKKTKSKKNSAPIVREWDYINPFALFPVLSKDSFYPAFKFSNETIANYLGPNFYSIGEKPMRFRDAPLQPPPPPPQPERKESEDLTNRIYYHYPKKVQLNADGTPKPYRLSQLIPYHVPAPKRLPVYIGPYFPSDEDVSIRAPVLVPSNECLSPIREKHRRRRTCEPVPMPPSLEEASVIPPPMEESSVIPPSTEKAPLIPPPTKSKSVRKVRAAQSPSISATNQQMPERRPPSKTNSRVPKMSPVVQTKSKGEAKSILQPILTVSRVKSVLPKPPGTSPAKGTK